MPHYLASVALLLFALSVITRVLLLRRQSIRALYFGNIDKKDFLIPPFVIFYFYCVFAVSFDWPTVSRLQFFQSDIIGWVGVLFCGLGLLLHLLSILAFGKSFRVGIDTTAPGSLITTGVFAFSRNPSYVAFWIVLVGQFLVFPNWVLLIYVCAATWLFHRQVLREEAFLRQHYGQEYLDYCARVRRYV